MCLSSHPFPQCRLGCPSGVLCTVRIYVVFHLMSRALSHLPVVTIHHEPPLYLPLNSCRFHHHRRSLFNLPVCMHSFASAPSLRVSARKDTSDTRRRVYNIRSVLGVDNPVWPISSKLWVGPSIRPHSCWGVVIANRRRGSLIPMTIMAGVMVFKFRLNRNGPLVAEKPKTRHWHRSAQRNDSRIMSVKGNVSRLLGDRSHLWIQCRNYLYPHDVTRTHFLWRASSGRPCSPHSWPTVCKLNA